MAVTPDEVRDLVTYQIGALAAFAARQGQRLQHVKPHGALYAMAERDAGRRRGHRPGRRVRRTPA